MTMFSAPNRRRFHLFPVSISRRERLQYLAEDTRAGLQGLLTALCMAFAAIHMACKGKRTLHIPQQEASRHPTPFANLPDDILLNIVDVLPLADVVALSMTHKAAGALSKHHR